MASEAQSNGTARWLREAQFKQAPACVRLNQTTLAAEAVEVQRAQGAATEPDRR